MKNTSPLPGILVFASLAIWAASGSGAIAQTDGAGSEKNENNEKKVGKIEDLTKPDLEDIKEIKTTLEESQTRIDEMANDSLASSVRKFNRGLENATRDIRRAVSEFEETYSVEAQAKLLESMSNIYKDLLSNFDEIPIDFLDNARDVYGNAIAKGQRIAKENLKRTEDDYAFKEKLLKSKVEKLRQIRDDMQAGGSQAGLEEAKRLVKDIGRIDRMLQRGKKSAVFWEKIAGKFARIGQQKSAQMDGLETSVMAFNQLRADIHGQKEAIDQMIVLGQLDELTTEEFESSVDDIMLVGDNLFEATGAAFDNVFANLLDDDPPAEETADDDSMEADDLNERIDAILSRYE